MVNSSFTIAALGDIMIQQRPDAEDIAAVAELLAPYDLVIGNVDLVVSPLGTPTEKWVNLNGPRELAHDIKAMGIDAVSMANNHSMDFRAEGMLDACQAYDEAGVIRAGAGANLAAASAPAFIRVGDNTIAFLSIACTLPPESAAGPNWPGIVPLPVHQAPEFEASIMLEQPGSVARSKTWVDTEALARITSGIAQAREQADIVVVSLHCGVPAPWRAPSQPMLQDYERPVCHALIEAGADAVIGNHAHELHSVEIFRDRPIAYCLGNFWIASLRDYAWMERETVIWELTFGRGSTVPSVSIRTLKMNDEGRPEIDETGIAANLLRERSEGVQLTSMEEARYEVAPSSE